MQNKKITRVALVTAAILSLPLLVMRFTDEMAWNLFDFIVAGALLSGAGLTYELVASRSDAFVYRVAAALAVGTALLLIWVNLAVGLIGSEDNPANVLYIGVLAVELIGTVKARLQPRGMSRALFATAIAQILVPLIAMAIWRPPFGPGVIQVLGVNVFFMTLWVVSALLFQQTVTPAPEQKLKMEEK